MSVFLTHIFGIDTFVARSRETIVNPQERTYLAALECWLQHLEAVGMQAYYLARAKVAHRLIVKIGEACCLATHGIGLHAVVGAYWRQLMHLFASYDDGRTSKEVACGDDSVFC